MKFNTEYKPFLWILGFFLLIYFMPLNHPAFQESVLSALELTKWYAREHVILCLVPAFFIAGVISVFVSQAAIVKYFGARAKKWVAYSIASVSGSILAVCSCTVLPLFAGIHNGAPVWVRPLLFYIPDPPLIFWRSSSPPVSWDWNWELPGWLALYCSV